MRPLSLDLTPDSSGGHAGHGLTQEQEVAASRREGSMLLSAAAGSGKTAVLVERYVRAVLDDQIDPARVLAITFTERAAWELKERIRARLHRLGQGALARDTGAASIGTIHGFCARMLRADPLAAGLPPGFTILEETTAARMRANAFSEALSEALRQAGEGQLDAAAAYGADRLRQIVTAIHAELRSRGQSRPALPAPPEDGAPRALAAHALLGRLLGAYGEAYQQRKSASLALDFDDLELHALRLLEAADTRARWMERFDTMMVDEFQDTNRRQLALLSAIEGENLFTVGDEWQSIYGFRHADVEVFREREQRLAGSGASYALTRNFRSRPGILEAVNAAFSSRFGERFSALVPAREPAKAAEPAVEVLITDTGGWEQEDAATAAIAPGLPPAPLWRQAEARLLAKRLRALIDDDVAQASEIALLLRSMTDASLYEAALGAEGVPSVSVMSEIWRTQEAQDAIAGLRALANPLDELALQGVLAGPACGLSPLALRRLAHAGAQRGDRGLWRTIREGRDEVDGLTDSERVRLGSFFERFGEHRATAGERTLARLLEDAASGFPAADRRLPSRARSAAVCRLRRLASDFEALEGRDLRGFAEHLEQLAAVSAPIGPQAPRAAGEAVSLMSIHAAKGLEFSVVCVADLGRAAGGRDRPYVLVEGDRIGLRVPRLDGGAPEPAFDYESLMQARAKAEELEEDRILYVAMTRARERLLLSGAASFERWPQDAPGCAPIAWIAPVLIEDLPARLAAAVAQPDSDPTNGSMSRVGCLLSSAGNLSLAAVSSPAPPPAPNAALIEADLQRGQRRPPDLAREALHESRPAIGDLVLGEALSYSALSELERCGYRYYLERVLRLAPTQPSRSRDAGERDAERARAIGQVAHAAMERMRFSAGVDLGAAEIQSVADQLGVELEASACEEIARMLSGIGQTTLYRRLAGARNLRTEQPFSFWLRGEQASIGGAFDAIATLRDGSRLIVDYKTNAVEADEDLEALVWRDYQLQRLAYALAALRDGARVVEVAHWYLHLPEQPVIARFGQSDTERLEAELAGRIDAARRKGFAVSDAPHRGLCGSCPGRQRLCSWPASATDARRPPDRPARG